MPSPQRTGAALPLDQQSVLPAVRGLPWWGAVLVAGGLTVLGAVIDGMRIHDLGSVFKFLYLLGCVAAALAVRRRALFTAATQPPLIGFVVSMVALYQINSEQASSSTRSLIFKVLLPIAANFPWMATTFVVTLVLVVARWYLTRDKSGDRGNRLSSRRPKGDDRPDATTDDTRQRTARRRHDADGRARRTSRAAKTADTAKTDSVKTATAPKTSTRAKATAAANPRGEDRRRASTRPARPKRATPKPSAPDESARETRFSEIAEPDGSAPARDAASAAHQAPARPRRATAGQVMRAEAGQQIGAEMRPSAATDLAPYESTTSSAGRSYQTTRSRSRR